MKQTIYQMWSIQESLLQQYRAMALTLLGLISAGILVGMSVIADNWALMSGLPDKLRTAGDRSALVGLLLIYALMVILLVLGTQSVSQFRRITDQRGRLVTFFQNLLIAEENGRLRTICARHGLNYPLELLSVFRRIDRDDVTPLTFEQAFPPADVRAFVDEIRQVGGAGSDPARRHYAARAFLSVFIYRVFNWFFLVAWAFVLLAAANFAGIV